MFTEVSTEMQRDVQSRLLRGDRTASDDLVRLFLPRLVARLDAQFPLLRGDPELEGCAVSALFEHVQQPERFREEAGSLERYLQLAARRDALNLVQRRTRTSQRQLPLEEETVAGAELSRNIWQDEVLGIMPGLPDHVTLDELRAQLQSAVRAQDYPVLELVLEGEATLENCIAALGLDGESSAVRAQKAKQSRDRIHAALRRVRERYQNE